LAPWQPPLAKMKTDLYDLTLEDLTALLVGWGEPPFRARQVWNWLYRQLAADPAEMTSLPLELRERLGEETRIGPLETLTIQRSVDGETEKRLFQLHDGETIETVLMEYESRNTLCISTQVGCGMGCVFCATGQMGFRRNLTAGEIVAQVIYFERELRARDDRLTNVVFMGMGEPLHNYDATVAAVRRLSDPLGFDFGVRRITISTVGLVPQIRRLAHEGLQVRLAISLHAATDEERQRLLPVARRWSLQELIDAVQEYVDQTGRRVTFEWALIQGQNDTPQQAHALGSLLSGLLSHVNLIPLNPTAGYAGRRSASERIARFQAILDGYGVPNTVRLRRGIDIQAGCGQLRQKAERATS
jgi:23S rRNA (adenine2503-C2)-methyltransferase